MKNSTLENVRGTVQNWWLSLILGILFIVVGIWMIFAPATTYVALSILFSVFMFVSGIFEITFAATNRHLQGWGWYLTGGIIDLLLGILLMSYPALTMATIPFIIALWLIFRGFSAIGLSIDFSQMGIKGWGWSLFLGILTVICALLVIFEPMVGAAFVVYLAAFAFLFIGIFRLFIAFGMQRLNRELNHKKRD